MKANESLVNPLGETIGTRKSYEISHKELAKIIILANNITEGHWQIDAKFDIISKNVIYDKKKSCPGFLASVQNIALMRQDGPTERSVNAAEINPQGNEVN